MCIRQRSAYCYLARRYESLHCRAQYDRLFGFKQNRAGVLSRKITHRYGLTIKNWVMLGRKNLGVALQSAIMILRCELDAAVCY